MAVRRSLVAAQAAAVRQTQHGLPQAERAVLVAVEFTGERRKLTAAARLARNAAAVSSGTALAEKGEPPSAAPKHAADLDFEASLAEFEELARSAGAEIAATLVQRRPRPDPATLVGGGKLEEIEGVIASTGADLVLFDHDLTPSQLRNLEAALPCRVIDRTQLILDIFARHARTREGPAAGGAGAAGVPAAAPGRSGKGNVSAWRRYRDPRTGRNAAGDGSPQDQPPHRSREGAVGVGATDSPAAAAAAGGRAGSGGRAGWLHQCRQEHAVQCADRGGRAGVVADVRDARPQAAAAAASVAQEDSAVGHGGFHPESAAHAGHQLSCDARRGGAGRAAAARARCVKPRWWRNRRLKCKRCWPSWMSRRNPSSKC